MLDNTNSNTTYLDNPLTNGEPDAVLSVTQDWNPGGGRGVYNDHPISVLYDQDIRSGRSTIETTRLCLTEPRST